MWTRAKTASTRVSWNAYDWSAFFTLIVDVDDEYRLKVFEDRPVWSKVAVLNQFTANEAREIHKYNVLPCMCGPC
jgi:hypothetical protein